MSDRPRPADSIVDQRVTELCSDMPMFLAAFSQSNLTKSTAIQYGPEKIRCNSVHPGIIETEMTREVLADSEKRAKRLAMTPLGIFADAHDVALAVLYLSSDESRYVTGSELIIDGGITAGVGLNL